MDMITVDAISVRDDNSQIRILDVPDRPGLGAELLEELESRSVRVEILATWPEAGCRVSLSVCAPEPDLDRVVSVVATLEDFRDGKVTEREPVGIVSVSGGDLADTPGAAARLLRLLSHAGIPISMISTSRNSIACAIPRDQCAEADVAVRMGFVTPGSD